MEHETNHERDEIIDIIKTNNVAPAPNQSIESLTLMYMVGDGKLFITVQRNQNKNILSAFCIKNSGHDKVYVIIDEPIGAQKVFDALEEKIKKQKEEIISLYQETKRKKCKKNDDHQR